jgi:tRNA(fMet)-specific endonuclease VapC
LSDRLTQAHRNGDGEASSVRHDQKRWNRSTPWLPRNQSGRVTVILDTNAVSALLAGDPVHLPVVVIGEYRYGLLGSHFRGHLQGLLETLLRESFVLRVDEVTAETYSHVRDELHRKGRPIPENDIWIAALRRR